MKTSDGSLKGWMLRNVLTLSVALSTAGCSAPLARLDDAQLGNVRLATDDEKAQYARAEDSFDRETFKTVTYFDALSGQAIVFTKSNYDAYLAYKQTWAESLHLPKPPRFLVEEPVLRIQFFTRRLLIEPDSSDADRVAEGHLYFCHVGNPWDDPIGWAKVMWHGQFVTGQDAQNIKATLDAEPEPQEYEVIVKYQNSGVRPSGHPGLSIVRLMPLTGDLCFALVRVGSSFLDPATSGRPLRIDRQAAEAALGPLPRDMEMVHRE